LIDGTVVDTTKKGRPIARNNVQSSQSVGLLSVGGAIFSGKAKDSARKLIRITIVCI